MSQSLPRIAVLIPAYKAEATIGKTLDSLKACAEPHDIVIVDDGSPSPLQNHLSPQANLTILRAPRNGGITAALNLGLQHILERGYDYVARLDADDAATPDRLAKQRAFLDANPEVALVGGWGRIVAEDGRVLFHLHHPTEHDAIARHVFANSAFIHPTLMFRTDIFRKVGLYSEDFPSVAEDYELTRRILRYAKGANLPEYLIDYTISTQGLSQQKRRAQLLARLRVQVMYRDFSKPEFYLGILKTLLLLITPSRAVMKLKQRLKGYQAR